MSSSIFRIGQTGDRPLPPLPPDSPPIIQALRYGITAPSAHNTQPWRIELVSDTEARVYFDPARRLPVTDPPGRQVHISHGTLIEMTAIAATSLGYRTEVELLPNGEMAIPEFGTKPTARIGLVADPAVGADPLFAQILTRRTSRLGHDGPPLTDAEREQIAAQAQFPGVAVGWVPQDQLATVLDIAARAMAIEVNDHDLFDETRQWFRFSDREIAQKGDGLHLDTSGLSGLSLALARWFTRPRNWDKSYNRGPYLKGFADSVKSTRAMLTLTTPANTMHEWITTGRAYMRAQLAADRLGFRFQPTSQVLQEYRQMDELRIETEHLLGVTPPAKIQMLVRVGRTKQPGLSPRRNLSAIIQTRSARIPAS
jgi:nitroreductase